MVNTNPQLSIGTWVWGNQITESDIPFLQEKCVKELYFDSFDLSQRNLIKECNDAGIKTLALDGADYWMNDLTKVDSFFQKVSAYQHYVNPDEQLQGVRLDVEPHTSDLWGTDKQQAINNYVAFYSYAQQKAHDLNLSFSVDIPHWFDNPANVGFQYNGQTISVAEWLIKHAADPSKGDSISLMDYSDKENYIIAHAEDEVAWGKESGVKIYIGVDVSRASSENNPLAFYEEGELEMKNTLKNVVNYFINTYANSNIGVEVHHFNTWKDFSTDLSWADIASLTSDSPINSDYSFPLCKYDSQKNLTEKDYFAEGKIIRKDIIANQIITNQELFKYDSQGVLVEHDYFAGTKITQKDYLTDGTIASLDLSSIVKFAPDSVKIGAWLGSWPDAEIVDNAEFVTGDKMDFINLFVNFDTSYSTLSQSVDKVYQNDSTALITWEPTGYTTQDIISGALDAQIIDMANGLKSLNQDVRVRLMHEPNGNWYSWALGYVENDTAPNTDQSYIDAYRHVVDIFRAQGADNVKWVYNINNTNCDAPSGNGNTTSYMGAYPGDNYVDYVSIDGYNWGTALPGHNWQSFEQVFDNAYNALVGTNKPIMITEVGSTTTGGDRTTWLNSAINSIETKYPKIESLIWFNENKETDWSLWPKILPNQNFVASGTVSDQILYIYDQQGALTQKQFLSNNQIYEIDSYTNGELTDKQIFNNNEDTISSNVSCTLGMNNKNLILTGTSNTTGIGNNLDNIIEGNAGNNILDGKAGADRLIGGIGDDSYIVDNINDIIVENSLEGTDSVTSTVSYTLSTNVENLTLSGTSNSNATGNALNNTLKGNTGDNIIDGGLGADKMFGKAGNDTYLVNSTTDSVTENALEGNDTIISTISYTLGANLENLTLSGTDNLNGTGNTLNNTINGNGGNNIIDGGLGVDTMVGGAGADTYYVDNLGDVVIENANEGTDKVISKVSYTLGANVENLVFSGTANFNGVGNALNNTIVGTIGNNVLNGLSGADTMIGSTGNDTYYVDNIDDVIVEKAFEGTDTVISTISYSLGETFENLTLSGTANINATGTVLNNIINGNSGNNIIDGGLGADTMAGGAGSDTYYVDNVRDVVIETTNLSTDTVISKISYTLTTNVENLILADTASINGTGNSLNNVITGNIGSNIINGGTGADKMIGKAGNDTYYVDNIGDVIVENKNEGTDSVISTISYTLGETSIEYLTLSGTANLNGTGNSLNNYIIGNNGNNSINGGVGADYMIGGAGKDTYYVENCGDIIIENTNGGSDTVISTISYTLGTNLENLTLSGTDDLNGIGNTLNNIIIGNNGNNIINGSLGADTMMGEAGNDTYYVDNAGDVIFENTDVGTDTVISTISYTLGRNIENLTLLGNANLNGTGNLQNNTIIGNKGNNTLNGALGADTMTGGLGNDTYYVDDIGDVAIENTDAGTDRVLSSISYTLESNIENLILLGISNINGTGNSLNNTINGNGGSNILDGGRGDDTLAGGTGNDSYIFDTNAGKDLVTDLSGSDSISFGQNVDKSKIAIFRYGNDLIIDYNAISNSDVITIKNQFMTSNSIEKIQLSDNSFITNSNINSIIQAMTTFAHNNQIQLTNIDVVKGNTDLMAIISNSWHY